MKKSVLIADDNAANLYLLKSILESQGWVVSEAENGKTALEMARAQRPDLIVSDILMPVMDGYSFCRECKKEEILRDVPFVFYTATYTEPKDEQFALDLGADRFILKPEEPEDLIQILIDLLEEKDRINLAASKPLGEEMEFFRRHNEILFSKLEKKMSDLEAANRELGKLEKKYRGVLENMDDAYYEVDLKGNFVFFNEALVTKTGYSREELTGMNYQQYMSPDSCRQVLAVFTQVYQTGRPVALFDYEIIMKDGRKRYEESWVNLILDKNNRPIGFRGMARDVTDRKESIERLREAFVGTVQAIASVVEAKDPYTAGHQRRVADIARTIAQEMRLSREQIEGIAMAGIIHDIGKVSVPAEILSSPRKLTALEFNLIKTHAQSGYDILKDIKFSWPVARMVLEHHERIDGSGYPKGLTGENILLESRILAVADVVEAMATHRPYRAALGLEPALQEITKNRGVLFDAEVVDACLCLFREKGYQIKE